MVGEILRDWDVLESSGGKFQLEFFGSSFSSDNYLGIKTTGAYSGTGYIWVANRDSPLVNHSGFLNLTSNGTLMINSTTGSPFIVNLGQQVLSSAGNLSLTLLDTGNLVLRGGQEVIWQSFDFPVDTWVHGMKIGLFDLKSARPRQQSLTSWLSPFVPSPGAFTLGVNPNNTKQLVIWRRGAVYWRSGIWRGGYINLLINEFKYISNENESYFTLSLEQGEVNEWITLNSSGGMDMNAELANGWSVTSFSCDSDNGDWSFGCVNTLSPSNCSRGDEFVPTTSFSGVFDGFNFSATISIDDCREICMKNCSCIAYASPNLDGTGCMFSGGTSDNGFTSKTAYIRQNLKDDGNKKKKKRLLWVFIAVPIGSLILIVIVISLCYWRRRIFCLGEKDDARHGRQDRHTELPTFEEHSTEQAGPRSANKDATGR